MGYEEEIPSGVPADGSVLYEEWLTKNVPGERVGLRTRLRGGVVVLVASPRLPLEHMRPPSPLAAALAGMIWVRLGEDYLRECDGQTFRVNVEDLDGRIQGYVLLHPDARVELFDQADLLLAEWQR